MNAREELRQLLHKTYGAHHRLPRTGEEFQMRMLADRAGAALGAVDAAQRVSDRLRSVTDNADLLDSRDPDQLRTLEQLQRAARGQADAPSPPRRWIDRARAWFRPAA
jgi:hypothetical protein